MSFFFKMSLILFCVLWASWICVLVSHIIIWGSHQSLLLQIFLLFLVFLAFLFFWHSHYTYVVPFVIVQQFLDILSPTCPPPPSPQSAGFFFFSCLLISFGRFCLHSLKLGESSLSRVQSNYESIKAFLHFCYMFLISTISFLFFI